VSARFDAAASANVVMVSARRSRRNSIDLFYDATDRPIGILSSSADVRIGRGLACGVGFRFQQVALRHQRIDRGALLAAL
jgi:hypothetical protein